MLVPIEVVGWTNRDFSFYSEGYNCIVGEIRIEKMDKNTDEVWLWNLKILEPFRGRGLGHLLIEDSIQYVKEIFPNVNKIILRVLNNNIPARKLYIEHGFRTVEKVKNGCTRKMELFLN